MLTSQPSRWFVALGALVAFSMLNATATAVAQSTPDLSQLVVGTDPLGDGWTVLSRGPQKPPLPNEQTQSSGLFVDAAPPIANYVIAFTQDPLKVDVGLYEYANRRAALASPAMLPPFLIWGNLSNIQTLTGYGDGPSYRVSGNNNGLTFVDGNIVVLVTVHVADSANPPYYHDCTCDGESQDQADALENQVASAEDALLQGGGTSASTAAPTASDLNALRAFPKPVLALPLDQQPYASWSLQGVQMFPGPTYRESIGSPDQGIGSDAISIQGTVGSFAYDPHSDFKPTCQAATPYCFYPPTGQTSGTEIFNGLKARGNDAFILHNTFPSESWSLWWVDKASNTSYQLSFGGDDVITTFAPPGTFNQSNAAAAQKLAGMADKLVVWSPS